MGACAGLAGRGVAAPGGQGKRPCEEDLVLFPSQSLLSTRVQAQARQLSGPHQLRSVCVPSWPRPPGAEECEILDQHGEGGDEFPSDVSG